MFSAPVTWARDLRITVPMRSESTPVQRLNREGVDAIRRHAYDKARTLFYQAYLLDPDDPFTLNNLGFMAEVDGEVDRAQRFYALASAQVTEATVDHASLPAVEGETFRNAISGPPIALEINRANFDAIRMLSQQRALEAGDSSAGNPQTRSEESFYAQQSGRYQEAQAISTTHNTTTSLPPTCSLKNRSLSH